jgi:hypothetical protein
VAQLWNSCLNDQYKKLDTGECTADSNPSDPTRNTRFNGYCVGLRRRSGKAVMAAFVGSAD